MKLLENHSLQPFNTFGIAAKARLFANFQSEEDLFSILQNPDYQALSKLILGGGSNLLLTGDFDGLVLKNDLKGIEIIEEDEDFAFISIGAGENWHDFVLWSLDNGFGGVENLSLIPGTVGAAPIQNIGAYGVELQDVFDHLAAFHISTREIHYFNNAACEFGYRDSIFKRSQKGNFVILSVTLKLTKRHHRLQLSYGDIVQVLDNQGVTNPTPRDVSNAVVQIRTSKLPDPAQIGNAGSFFKNPEISAAQFETLRAVFPSIVGYLLPDGRVKIPAGWLIEQCGWKGKRVGNTGSYARQALVLVNYGGATGAEIWALARAIQQSVMEKFGIEITPEVNII